MTAYPGRMVQTVRAPLFRRPAGEKPVDLLLALVNAVGDQFSCAPSVLHRQGERGLWLLYRDALWLWRDFTELYGDALAALSAVWRIELQGVTPERETAEVTVLPEGNMRVTQVSSLSGRPVDGLAGLGVQIEADSPDTAAQLAALCGAVDVRSRAVAVSRAYEGFLQGSALLAPTAGSAFLYLAWDDTADCAAWLDGLSAAQKAQLWRIFLEDGVQPLEFDWLWSAYRAGMARRLLEWLLALRQVLRELGFQVEQAAGRFRVLDAAGTPRRFDLVDGGPAEKVFLKLLFPLDKQ